MSAKPEAVAHNRNAPSSTAAIPDERPRCNWPRRPLEIAYHDREWGTPCHDDHRLFEYLLLDCMQAGLNWYVILLKREHLRRAFAAFNPEAVAHFGAGEIAQLMQDASIIRNRQKITAVIGNARHFLALQEQHGSFARYLWRFVNGTTIHNHLTAEDPAPVTSPESDALAKDMYARGFRFFGSITAYAFMESAGLYNNHLRTCFRYQEIARC